MCGDMVGEDGRAGGRRDTVVVAAVVVVGTSRRGGKPLLARVTTASRERGRKRERFIYKISV